MRLENAMAGIKARIRKDAQHQFARFNHFGKKSFFDVYPVPLNSARFMAAHYSVLEPRLATASVYDLKAFTALYPEKIIGADRWSRLDERYEAAYRLEKGILDTGDLLAALGVATSVKARGFEPKAIPNLKIAFAEVTSKTLLREGRIDFEASVDVDLPVEAVKGIPGRHVNGSGKR